LQKKASWMKFKSYHQFASKEVEEGKNYFPNYFFFVSYWTDFKLLLDNDSTCIKGNEQKI
jgi:hypothetical protein